MCEASALSVALFASMHALTCAAAQLHEKESERKESERKEGETCIVSALDRAMRVAHAACEAALTRVEPMYDAVTCDAAEHKLCNEMVASALKNAKTIVSALEYASTQSFLSVDLCGDAAMRAAILTKNIGAVALGVVLLSEFPSIVPPRGLFLHALQHNRNVSVVQLLLSSPALVAHITDCTSNGETVLMLALTCGNAQNIIALLACPAVVASAGVVNKPGFTALMLASYHGYTAAVKVLLACSAVIESVGVVDTDGDTALMLAVLRGHVEAVTVLLSCPAVVASASVVNNDGYTALMIAVMQEHVETVIALLLCPTVVASAGAVNKNGYTALKLAVLHGCGDIVTALLACPGVVNNGFTALMIAEQNGHAR